jgi:putative ABC transport system permease protein
MLQSYLKLAVKVLLRRKFFTFISLFGISITLLILMVATAQFDAMYGPMAPETKLDRTLGVFRARMSGEHSVRSGSPGYALLDQTVRNLPGAEEVSLHTTPGPVTSYPGDARITSYMKRTDGAFWRIYDFGFLEGGPYTDEDEKNGSFVAVINEPTRRRFFGDDPAVGRTLEADGQTFRVVGVVEAVPFFRYTVFSDLYVPISTAKSDAYRREMMGSFMASILAHGRSDLPGIRREFATRVSRIPMPDPKNYSSLRTAAETPFESWAGELFDFKVQTGRAEGLLALIIGAMVLFMVLPAINLVNLNVSRIMERASEIGVRKAFGASRRTLVGQFVVENILLCLVGGAIGLVLSIVALQAIAASGIIPYARFALNYRVFLYGIGLSAFFGLLSGVYPALKMSRLHPVEALRGGSR